MRIALIKTGALGDVVRTTSLLPALRRVAADDEIVWITAAEALTLLEGNPWLDLAVDIADPPQAAWRRLSYDWVVSLDDELPSCQLAARLTCKRLSGAYQAPTGELAYTPDVAEWFGMGRLRPQSQGGLERANQLKRANHATYGEILYRALGLPMPVARPEVFIPDAGREQARHWLRSAGHGRARPLVGLNTGAGGRWRFKAWGVEQTAGLARAVVGELGGAAVVLGGAKERERNQAIVSLAGVPGVVVAPSDLDLKSFAGLIAELDVLVSSDSLAMHLGVAAGRPVIAFFGPTSDREIDLFGLGEKVVTPLDCRCCYLNDCDVRPHCMQSISVTTLLAAVRRWLEAVPRAVAAP